MSIDFQALKERIPIANVANGLELNYTTEDNGQLRARCTACNTENKRSLVVTPELNLFYCFASKKGGDQIALYAHIRGVTMKQAGEDLAKSLGGEEPRAERKEYDLDDYGKKLDRDHPAATSIFSPAVAEAIGAGFASKGLLKGLVAIPVRLPSGHLIGYIGVEEAKTPKEWRMP